MFEIHRLVTGRYRNRSRPVRLVTGPFTTGKVNPAFISPILTRKKAKPGILKQLRHSAASNQSSSRQIQRSRPWIRIINQKIKTSSEQGATIVQVSILLIKQVKHRYEQLFPMKVFGLASKTLVLEQEK
jgi:hypothetical protein